MDSVVKPTLLNREELRSSKVSISWFQFFIVETNHT